MEENYGPKKLIDVMKLCASGDIGKENGRKKSDSLDVGFCAIPFNPKPTICIYEKEID